MRSAIELSAPRSSATSRRGARTRDEVSFDLCGKKELPRSLPGASRGGDGKLESTTIVAHTNSRHCIYIHTRAAVHTRPRRVDIFMEYVQRGCGKVVRHSAAGTNPCRRVSWLERSVVTITDVGRRERANTISFEDRRDAAGD